MEFVMGTDPEVACLRRSTMNIYSVHGIISDPEIKPQERVSAIGVDGNRPTTPIEFRPGISSSGEDLVNRLSDLVRILKDHFHPNQIVYKAGAWASPEEPLGGHIHYSWKDGPTKVGEPGWNRILWRAGEVLNGLQAQCDFLTGRLFSPIEIDLRVIYAEKHGKDFAKRFAFRPSQGWERVLRDRHMEYRGLASWMTTPEAAYAALGGAETVINLVHSANHGDIFNWEKLINTIYLEKSELGPIGGPSLAAALRIAEKHKDEIDIMNTWIS